MIRSIVKKDLEECLELLKELTVVGDNFDYFKIFEEIIYDKNHYIFVYEIDAKIVGMATIFIEQKFIHFGSCVGHIEDVVVASKYRNLNIGKKLIFKCIEISKERNCYKVILDCDKKHIGFYEKVGFTNFGFSMKIKN